MARMRTASLCLAALLATGACALTGAQALAASGPGILMGEAQKANWEAGTAECKHLNNEYCADQISQGQFVAWPFVAEHSGTVEAIFAILGTSVNTGAEIGIYANRTYAYPEITFNGEKESSRETWTPARFKQYEAEIPPEDPGKLLGTSGKVAESAITNLGWTEFKLEHPVRVLKGEKYWLANTTFATVSSVEDRRYQDFLHERMNTTEDQPWGNYSNEPSNWATVVRPLAELPSPETTKINCEICNTTGWLQEEPKKFKLVNPNREAQEEGGQTYSYAYGTIEEGTEEGPTVIPSAPTAIGEESATLNATVDPNGSEVTACLFEYGITNSYGLTVPCSPAPGSGTAPVAVSASLSGLSSNTPYHFRIVATNLRGANQSTDQTFATLPNPALINPPSAPTAVTAAGATGQALVSWTAPSNNGGSAITSYTVTPYLGSAAQTPVLVAATATSATITGLANGAGYTFTVTAANAVGSGPPSVASAAVIPRDTIFNFQTPVTINSEDAHPIELGVKFNSSLGGYVTGVRFYKAASNTGTHTGSLWTTSGKLLAEATFTSETASGWQQVNFSTPVAITANTTYVAAYFAPKGDYSETDGGFAAAGLSNPPLSALANATSPNGLYVYSSTPKFPANTWQAGNYWVDVDFEP
jgi:hypothetical protein